MTEIIDDSFMAAGKQAFKDGATAFRLGLNQSENPHTDDFLAHQWGRGWAQASYFESLRLYETRRRANPQPRAQ